MRRSSVGMGAKRRGTIVKPGKQDTDDIFTEDEVEKYLSRVKALNPYANPTWESNADQGKTSNVAKPQTAQPHKLGWDTVYRGLFHPLSYEHLMLKEHIASLPAKTQSIRSSTRAELAKEIEALENEGDDELRLQVEAEAAERKRQLKIQMDPKRQRLADISANLWKEFNPKKETAPGKKHPRQPVIRPRMRFGSTNQNQVPPALQAHEAKLTITVIPSQKRTLPQRGRSFKCLA